MTKTGTPEKLPRSVDELEELADYYDTHDTAAEMEDGEWVEPRPMVTTSLRVSDTVLDTIKQEANRLGVRHTTLIRNLLEEHVADPDRAKVSDRRLAQIVERLDRIEAQLARSSGSAKKERSGSAPAKRASTKKLTTKATAKRERGS